jgi:hypothetical protein
MPIKTTILMEFAPDYLPDLEYTESIFLDEDAVQIITNIDNAATSEKWRHSMFDDYNQRVIQSASSERYTFKIIATESQNIRLIEKAGRVKITPQDGDSYYIYDVNITDDYESSINTHTYTVEFTKDNLLNYATYLASNDVKGWFDLSPTENYVNRIEYTVRKPSYTQRIPGVNEQIGGIWYNYKFTNTNNELDGMPTVLNNTVFYTSFSEGTEETDMRVKLIAVDGDDFYFQSFAWPIPEFTEREITLSSEPSGEILFVAGTDLENAYTDSIYTFLFSKTDKNIDFGSTTEIKGIEQYEQIKNLDQQSVLVYLRPSDMFKIQKLAMCLPEDIKLVEVAKNGDETTYTAISIVGMIEKSTRTDLNELLEYRINIKYNNIVTNVNR